jgi:hypothetical protein
VPSSHPDRRNLDIKPVSQALWEDKYGGEIHSMKMAVVAVAMTLNAETIAHQ